MKKKFALVLSGGGFKGAFQVGALNYLKENWGALNPEGGPMHFDIISGVSAGALNGSMLAMDKLDQLNELWQLVGRNGVEEIYTSPFIDTKAGGEELKFRFDATVLRDHFLPDFKFKAGIMDGLKLLFSQKQREKFFEKTMEQAASQIKENLAGFRSIASNEPLYKKLQAEVNREAIGDCQFLCGFVSLDDGAYASVAHTQFHSNEDFIRGILASTAIPIVWDPVGQIHTADGLIRNSVDGGIRNNAPLSDVIQLINEDDSRDTEYTVIIINCGNGNVERKDFSQSNIFQIALRALEEITLSEIFNNDVEHYLQVNELVRQASQQGARLTKHIASGAALPGRPLRAFKTLLIQPADGVLGDMLAANAGLINRRVEHGRKRTEMALQNFVDGFVEAAAA